MADDAPPPEGVWTGKGQAGRHSSQGNSESKSANGALDLALVEGPWKHAFHLGQYQASGTLGLGYQIFDSDATKLAAQAGVGYLGTSC